MTLRSLSMTIAAASPRTEAWKVRNCFSLSRSCSNIGLVRAMSNGHDHDIGAHDLRVIAQIGFRHDQRILDCGARAGGEQPVEAAIERHAGDDRDQDRRRRGDDGEQSDDAHMQPRGGPPGAAGLHHLPHFAHDDAEQQQHRRRVREQQRDDDVVGRRNRRQVGENDEGDEGRQQRQTDRDRPEHPRFAPLGGRSRQARFRRWQPVRRSWTPGSGWRSAAAPRRTAQRGERLPGTDAFIQQCCRIATNPRRNSYGLVNSPQDAQLPPRKPGYRDRGFSCAGCCG